MPTLVIANKLYSSWSLRPWLLLRHLGIAFDEVVSPWIDRVGRAGIAATRRRARAGPDRRRPHGLGLARDPASTSPSASRARLAAGSKPRGRWRAPSRPRCIPASRPAARLPMNSRKRYAAADRGRGARRDVARIARSGARRASASAHGGPFLFGGFSVADAMFAPVVTRFDTYSIPGRPGRRAPKRTILGLPAFRRLARGGAAANRGAVPARRG